MDTDFLVVLATVADEGTGIALARTLVEEGLAACVQVNGTGTAVYRWEGQLIVDPQVQLIVKTGRAAWPALRDRWVELHADEVPELIALALVDGLPAYLSWIRENTAAAPHAGEK